MAKITKMKMDPERVARKNFSVSVQNIAFCLSLSRRMIDALELVRDYGWPLKKGNRQESGRNYEKYREAENRLESVNGSNHHVTVMRSLERRGLVIFLYAHVDWGPKGENWPGGPTITLSRAGEYTCGLLVEAGLMAPVSKERKTWLREI